MNIFDKLREDHRKAERLMERISATQAREEKLDLIQQLKKELNAHAEAENTTFYKEVALHCPDTSEEIDDAMREHEEIEEMLDSLANAGDIDNEWERSFDELRAAFAHHVREEESEMFDLIKSQWDTNEQERLGRDFEETEQRIQRAI